MENGYQTTDKKSVKLTIFGEEYERNKSKSYSSKT